MNLVFFATLLGTRNQLESVTRHNWVSMVDWTVGKLCLGQLLSIKHIYIYYSIHIYTHYIHIHNILVYMYIYIHMYISHIYIYIYILHIYIYVTYIYITYINIYIYIYITYINIYIYITYIIYILHTLIYIYITYINIYIYTHACIYGYHVGICLLPDRSDSRRRVPYRNISKIRILKAMFERMVINAPPKKTVVFAPMFPAFFRSKKPHRSGNATCGLGYETRSLVCGAESCNLVLERDGRDQKKSNGSHGSHKIPAKNRGI